MASENIEMLETQAKLGEVRTQLLELQTLLHREGIARQHLIEENGSLMKQLEQVILENNKNTNVRLWIYFVLYRSFKYRSV